MPSGYKDAGKPPREIKAFTVVVGASGAEVSAGIDPAAASLVAGEWPPPAASMIHSARERSFRAVIMFRVSYPPDVVARATGLSYTAAYSLGRQVEDGRLDMSRPEMSLDWERNGDRLALAVLELASAGVGFSAASMKLNAADTLAAMTLLTVLADRAQSKADRIDAAFTAAGFPVEESESEVPDAER